jgi:hypothetical protein
MYFSPTYNCIFHYGLHTNVFNYPQAFIPNTNNYETTMASQNILIKQEVNLES